MKPALRRTSVAGLAVAILIVVSLHAEPPSAQASHLCPNTGSPFGPFDFQTYEAAGYQNVYARTMELASFNQLFPEIPSFATSALETGDRAAGSGQLGAPYIPPVLLKSIAWIESGWAQGSYDPVVQYGEVGPVLASHDCGYGIMQVTSGMQNVSGVPNLDQAMIGGHYAFNVARGARILADKWNSAPEYRPIVGNRDPHILENWYYALWGYNGFSFKNHPLNPEKNQQRGPYLCNGSQPRSDYPYQELILGCVVNPPWRGGTQLWSPQAVALPNLSDPAFAGPLNVANWDPCSQSIICAPMDMPPASANQDPTVPPFNRSQVIGAPSIGLSTGSISLVAPPGGQSPSRDIAIGNGGSGVLAWRLTTSASWLRLSRVQGVSLGADLGYQHQIFSIHADASSLYPGTHTAQIIAESLYAGAAPTVITVTLETADGALVAAPDGHVYVLMGGLRRYISDLATFEGFGDNWSDIIPVPQTWLNAIPRGDDVPSTLADGRLISSPDGRVYAMQGGAKRWVTGGNVMTSCSYGFDSVARLSTATAGQIPDGSPLTGAPCPQPSFPVGTLLQESDGRVWVTIGNARRWITGGHAFFDCGYKWGNRNELGDSVMNPLSVFPEVTGCTSDGSLLWQADGSLHAAYGGLMRRIPNAATFEANRFDWSRITPLRTPVLPAGDPLLDGLATGRLVSAGGPVYVMDNGAKRWVPNADIFAPCGYNWSAISIVSWGHLAASPEGPPLQSTPCPRLTLPHGTLIRGSDVAVWATLGIGRTWMTSVGAISDCGFHIGNINIVPDGVLAGFPTIGGVNGCTSDGSLVATSDGKVSVVRLGWRRWVPSGPTFEANGLHWGALAPIADSRLPEAKALPEVLANGRLVGSPAGFVYVMESGYKRWITGGDVLSACGYGWDAIASLSDATVAGIPESAPLTGPPCPVATFANGTLLHGSDGRIWAVQSGQRHWITGGDVFSACGYLPANVDTLADSIVAALPQGPALTSPPCP